MNANRSKGSWYELKAPAKRQTHRFKDDEDIDFFEDTVRHHEHHKNSKEKADKHLSNLHGLLNNMPSQNKTNYKKNSETEDFNEKTSIPLLKHIASFKSNKTD